ncbi:MAG: restriction endonuclease [Lentisphaerae bacterium GWF2_44_16]|nr:MAG: restriction endonuclease [Lentisphaerae bacterium GWF2_44_16]
MERKNWSREELILAFNLYCKIHFGQISQKNPKIIELSKIIGRTPSSIAFKLVNFASLDPYHQQRGVKGMQNASKLDKEIYNEFSNNWSDLIFESESLLIKKSGKRNLEEAIKKEIEFDEKKEGVDVVRSIKMRINQSFFRTVVTSIYSNKCAVSNIDLPELLIASHIVPWSANKKERLNPSNGICLSPLYDKVFDKGLMTLTDDYKIRFSKKLFKISDKKVYSAFFEVFENQQINLPDKFYPKQEFIDFHRKNIFQK